jgi:hypothetical protein
MTSLQKAIKKAKETKATEAEKAVELLASNTKYINYKASQELESDLSKSLTAIATTLTAIKDVVTSEGDTYSVQCYATASYAFGPIMSKAIGIVRSAGSMFTDERQAEFEALTGITYLEAMYINSTIGNPAYFTKKGELIPETAFDEENLETAMVSLCEMLNIPQSYTIAVNETSIAKWFQTEASKAEVKQLAFTKAESIVLEEFVIED